MDSASASANRVTGVGWNVNPIEHPMTAAWSLPIEDSEFRSLIRGFQPEAMEDRWMCCTDGPDQQGSIVVHIYRSWTRKEQFQLKAKALTVDGEAGGNGTSGAEITEIKWDRGSEPNEVAEPQAKDLAAMVCRYVLGCKLEAWP
ncbi:hypothetical protein BS50DRAFT_564572 [Corynespora cassiicola Philippines]|uniref:Uncharacterized protein n=1 Tax=Corynespora cassiicola Philippines TaxID=1448308 RepID=A0A2T2N3E9_CORCC|nr:hypothetical protein BS50DRAFT_564572 [Corynespora cassiicola Philippines]